METKVLTIMPEIVKVCQAQRCVVKLTRTSITDVLFLSFLKETSEHKDWQNGSEKCRA